MTDDYIENAITQIKGSTMSSEAQVEDVIRQALTRAIEEGKRRQKEDSRKRIEAMFDDGSTAFNAGLDTALKVIEIEHCGEWKREGGCYVNECGCVCMPCTASRSAGFTHQA